VDADDSAVEDALLDAEPDANENRAEDAQPGADGRPEIDADGSSEADAAADAQPEADATPDGDAAADAEPDGDVELVSEAPSVSAGAAHTCVLLEGGCVRCWGFAAHGQLGYGNTDSIGDDEVPSSAGDVPLL